MAYLIGTAGHVDHGKTTLIAALTGIDADRLPEEKSRGMTIDLGFAFIELPEIGRVSIVDVPGHERFIKNMLAGASGVDVALLCVAADEGVMPQTREHFEILRLLEARAVVVALTKCDMVDEDGQAIAEMDVRELLSGGPYADAPLIKVSAHTGSGLDELKQTLATTLSNLGPRAEGGRWFLPIDRVFSVAGHGTIVTGTLALGTVAAGAEGVLMPGSEKLRIRSVQTHGEPANQAEAGQRTALNVAGVRKESLHRGQAVGAPGALVETTCVNVRLAPVGEIRHGQRIRFHIGAGEFIGKLFLFDEAPGFAQVRLEKEVACARGQRAVIRKYSPATILAGAEIVTPNAQLRRKTDKEIAEIVGDGAQQDESFESRIMAELAKRPMGIETAAICEALGQTQQMLGTAFETLKKSGEALGFAGIWISKENYGPLTVRVLEAVADLHKQSPQAAGIDKAKVASRAGLRWPVKSFDRLAAQMAEDGAILMSGSDIRHPEHKVAINDKQEALLQRTLDAMRKGGAVVPSAGDLALEVGAPRQAIDEMIRLGLATNRLVKVDEGLFYPPETLEELKQTLHSFGKPFTVAEFRDKTGSSRKYALPLLQYFDETRFTKRLGDERIVIG
jgi:selenocysteine-specific elongation factor